MATSERNGVSETARFAEILDRNNSGGFGDPFTGSEFGIDGALQDDDVAGGDLLDGRRDGSPDVEDDEVLQGRVRSPQHGYVDLEQLDGGGVVAHRDLVGVKPGKK